MDLKELMIRQLTSHHLLEPVYYWDAGKDLCGIQTRFLSNVCHALAIRSGDFSEGQATGLVKIWTNRGTMHIFAASDLPLFLHEGKTHFLRSCDPLEPDGGVIHQ